MLIKKCQKGFMMAPSRGSNQRKSSGHMTISCKTSRKSHPEEQWEQEHKRREFNEKVEAANKDLREQKENAEKRLQEEAEQQRKRLQDIVEAKRRSLSMSSECCQSIPGRLE
jgi:DNA anti-recombination protein RmuC